MRNEKPLFSIIVPVYNEEGYIREALDSILAQTDPDWEAVLVDDGSTDTTPGILDEYAQKDERFRVFHKPNGGTSTAINKGIQEANGEWFCWLSGDDLFHSQKLEKHRQWMKEYPDVHFFFTGFWLIQPDGKKIDFNLDWLTLENPAYHLITLFRANYIIGIGICIKREAWLRNEKLNEKLHYAQDFDMWLRLMLNTKAKYLPDRTCTVRYHPGQDTSQFPLAPAFDAAKVIIRTLNEHPFKELFPGTNLQDKNVAIEILNRTIDFVAGEPRSNIYMQGLHPLLHFRILEWLWDPATDPRLREELRLVILSQASNIISLHPTSPFGLLWQATRVALNVEKPIFKYFPCEAHKVGELNYYLQRAEASEVEEPLRAYLKRIDGLAFEETSIPVGKAGQVVLLLPPDIFLDDPKTPKYEIIRETWQHLSRAGFFVLLVGKSKYTMGLVDGVPFLGAENLDKQAQLIMVLGDIDTVVDLSQSGRLKADKVERLVRFDISNPALSGLEISIALIHKIQSTSRYEPTRTLIKRHVRRIYHLLIPAVIREKAQLGQRLHFIQTIQFNFKQLSFKQKMFHILRKIYHMLVPQSVREMAQLGQWLRSQAALLKFNMFLSRKQQVVFIAYALWGGGVEKVLYELAHGLNPKNYATTVVYLHKEDNPIPYDPRVKTVFLQLTEDDINSVNQLPGAIGKDLDLGSTWLHEGEYSIGNAIAEIWPFVWALRKLFGIFSKNTIFIPMDERNTVILWLSQLPPYRKVLASQHYPYSQAQPIRFPTEQMRRVKEFLYLNACQNADAVTFDSEGSRWDLINNFGASPKRTLFMPNLINCTAVIEKSKQLLPEDLKRFNRRTIFTQVARMANEKNPLLLIDACELLCKKYDNFVVFYIGNGPLFEEMHLRINQKNLSDHILLLNEQANPYPYVANARALLLTSLAESSPLVLVESMLCGAVPIATDCIAGPRELLCDGKFGLLVPPNNPQSFADAMYQIAIDDDLHNRLRENAPEWAWRFDTQRVIKEWEGLISHIAKNRIDDWVTKNSKDKDERVQRD
jgi:glycosyltransferase involved in cell wall biosynthesis